MYQINYVHVKENVIKLDKFPVKFIKNVQFLCLHEWFAACKGHEPAICNFDVAGPLTEMVLPGNIAIRAGKELCWDGENMRTTNDKDANNYLKEY